MPLKFYPDDCDKVDKLLHYSLKRPFSFGVKFMHLIGGRGVGKTYGVRQFLISDFIKHGHTFAWFRTTDTALDRIRNPQQFFGRIQNLKELGVESYDIKKDIVYINKKIAGYLFPVATFYNIKGADYSLVNGVWDEFMRAKGERPVPGKREKFFDAVESIFRNDKARVFLISNSTNQFDECLAPFKIVLKEFGTYLYRDKDTLIHYVRPSKAYIESRANSLSALGMTEDEKKMTFSNEFTSFGDFGKQSKGTYLYSVQVDDNKFLSFYKTTNNFYVKQGLPENPTVYTNAIEYVTSSVSKMTVAVKKVLTYMHDKGLMIFYDGYCRAMFQEAIL